MDKATFLTEINRLAAEEGRAPGWEHFESLTGARKSDWYPRFWLRWGDALREAGYAPNQFQGRTSDETLLLKYIGLIKELGRIPVDGEVRRKPVIDSSFPNHRAFARFGGKAKLLTAIEAYCRATTGLEDVQALCAAFLAKSGGQTVAHARSADVATGFVYLMRSGRHYKIGRTNSVGRRDRELAIKIPIPPVTIHTIETDDPDGVEAYWHKRFAAKRGEGEWFDLSPEDISAFKRWKRII